MWGPHERPPLHPPSPRPHRPPTASVGPSRGCRIVGGPSRWHGPSVPTGGVVMLSTRTGAGASSATASLQSSRSSDQLQTRGPVRPVSLPAASDNKPQDRPRMTPRAGILVGLQTSNLCRGVGPGIAHSHPAEMHRAILLPAHGGQLPARAFHRSARPFIRVQRRGSRPIAAHILPSQPRLQFWGRLGTIHHSCLSNPPSLAGSTNASKRGRIIGNSGQAGAA